MFNRRRIPQTQSEFDLYLKIVEGWLKIIPEGGTETNGERLGMTAAEIILVTGYLALWWTGLPANPGAYEIHCDPNGKKNSKQVVKIMDDFTAFFQPILNRISGSPKITIEDRNMLNIAPPVEHHTPKTKVIETGTAVSSKPVGAGEIKIICLPIESETQGISEEADSIQVALCIVDSSISGEYADGGKVKKTAPTSINDVIYHIIRTKAKVILAFDHKYRGKQVFIYARQFVVAHPELAGPWSEVYITIIP